VRQFDGRIILEPKNGQVIDKQTGQESFLAGQMRITLERSFGKIEQVKQII